MPTTLNERRTIELLVSHRTLGQAPRKELEWLAEHGTHIQFEKGELIARHGDLSFGLHVVFSGRFAIYLNRGGTRRILEWGAGDVSGMLPYSRMTVSPGDVFAEEVSEVLYLPNEVIPDLIRTCYDVTAIMVHVLIDRARRFTSADLRDEKMISLGKLAAGFAHEVNNPASAALRDASALARALSAAEAAARSLSAAHLSEIQLAELDVLTSLTKPMPGRSPISGLELADREDAMESWLTSHNVTESLAAELAGASVATADLDRLGSVLAGEQLETALRWLTSVSIARTLVADIERAAKRIHSLVDAAKGFTHMDRTLELECVDISKGLQETVLLLGGKARARSVVLAMTIPPDLPAIRGYVAEINQVWMNLIDNAIDAAAEAGRVSVFAAVDQGDVCVSVVDDGQGISPDIRERIFDPFFTTKQVGQGTGLGLDIVRRVVQWHNGDVSVESQQGKTEFKVRLPISGAQ